MCLSSTRAQVGTHCVVGGECREGNSSVLSWCSRPAGFFSFRCPVLSPSLQGFARVKTLRPGGAAELCFVD